MTWIIQSAVKSPTFRVGLGGHVTLTSVNNTSAIFFLALPSLFVSCR